LVAIAVAERSKGKLGSILRKRKGARMVSGTEKFIVNPVVVLREEFDDWAVLFNPDTAEAVGINPVGVAIWKLMDGTRNLNDIVEEIKKSFDDVPESVVEETKKFADDLVEAGLVGFELESEA
jgi:SynChlorMet cassette protein ScmD